MRRAPLPATLTDTPFLVSAALAAGLPRGRIDGPDLLRPFRGVRASSATTPARLYAPRLRPGDRFSHTTAAELWGAPLPRRLEGAVHVSGANGRVRVRGAIGHESDRGGEVRFGLPVSSVDDLFLELAGTLSLDELVAVGDYLVHVPRFNDVMDWRPYTNVDRLRDTVAGRRHARAARTALDLVRQGVESPKETELRMLLHRAGLPEPVCGYHVTGIGWFDLAWPADRVLSEYDGDQHRTSTRQYERDIERYELAAEAGWTVIRVRQSGLGVHAARTVARVRRALER